MNVGAHVAVALAEHCRRLRRDGLRVPPELAVLVAAFSVSDGQGRSIGALDDGLGEGVGMPMAFTFKETADLLAVSESTVRRAVTSGELLAVRIGASRRVRSADLTRYVEQLLPTHQETEHE